MNEHFILITDLIGLVAFAISGTLAAMKKRLDPFGVLIIAFVTAIGGGTLRDILLDVPVEWMKSMIHVYFIIGTTIFAVIFRNRLNHFRKSLLLFDTIGIGIYTLIGIEKALEMGFSPTICIALGTMTACFGGVSRDLLCSEIPVIFRKEIYATACIIGGIIYFILLKTSVSDSLIFIISGAVVILIRLMAVRFNLKLPTIYSKNNNPKQS